MAMGETPLTVNNSGEIQSQGLKLELTGDRHTAVGQMASLQAKLTDSRTNQPVSDAVFEVRSTQLENNWVAFAYQGVANAQGKLAWQEQFFDGAPHKIEVKVSPQSNGKKQFQPFQVTKEIEVKGIAPPMSVRLISWLYFTGVLGFRHNLWTMGKTSSLTGSVGDAE